MPGQDSRCSRVDSPMVVEGAQMRCADGLFALALFASSQLAHGEAAYVSDEQANVIHVIEAPRWTQVKDIPVGHRPRGMVLGADRRRLYVAVGNDDRIDVIDLATRRVVDHLPSGPDPERFALAPDGRTLYVANENDSAVSF